MEGSEERTCADGGWTGAAPRCEFTRCPDPEPVANAAELKQIPGPAGDNRLGAKVIGSIPNILYCRSKITFNITIKVFLNVLLFLVFCFHGDGYKPCNISGEDLTIFVYSTAQFM